MYWFMRLLRINIALLVISHTSFLEALTIFPPPSPVYLGTTVRIAWTSESLDPPFFDLDLQCQGLPITPRVNASTVQGELFVGLPSGFNLGISLADADRLQVRVFPTVQDVVLIRPPVISHYNSNYIQRNDPFHNADTSLIIKTEMGSVTVTLSTVSTHRQEETSSLPSSTFAKPAASQTASSSTGPLQPHHVNVGAIVGASVGGVSLVAAFIVIIRLWMRPRPPTAPIIEPLPYSPEEISTPANRSSTSRTSGGDNVHDNSHDNLLGRQASTQLEEGTEERLQRMVEQMSERILALEAQQREAGSGDQDQPLPPYSNREAQNNPLHDIEESADVSSRDLERQHGLAS
ncbi:hypothetical protein DXG01_016617 [Tephrocybe rancida]|nr:hypothetical protein DXG01_016617 [Tephrocybe rancida]